MSVTDACHGLVVGLYGLSLACSMHQQCAVNIVVSYMAIVRDPVVVWWGVNSLLSACPVAMLT